MALISKTSKTCEVIVFFDSRIVWPLPRMADWVGCSVHRLIGQDGKLAISF